MCGGIHVCVCVYVNVFCLGMRFIASYWDINGTDVLIWLCCIPKWLAVDHSFQSFVDASVLLLATVNNVLVLPLPLLTLHLCCHCRCWSLLLLPTLLVLFSYCCKHWWYHAATVYAISGTMLLLVMPLFWRRADIGIADAMLPTLLTLLMLCCHLSMLTLCWHCCWHCGCHAATAAVVADPTLLLPLPLLTVCWSCYCPFWYYAGLL